MLKVCANCLNISATLQICKCVKQNGGGSLDIQVAQDSFEVALATWKCVRNSK